MIAEMKNDSLRETGELGKGMEGTLGRSGAGLGGTLDATPGIGIDCCCCRCEVVDDDVR
jgi:hypothetical protein